MESKKAFHGRRLPCQIMYAVMSLASKGEGRTRIMYGANISYALLVKYLAFLESRGFLAAKGSTYEVTANGRLFMADLRRMLDHLKLEDEQELLTLA
ncbi:MAG: winged helix-turn-helix domain-containing protein [Halobacteriales archaeon]|nr:winged helix-turn-helix domain-containing protein [Halobacteriales archaeon]